MPAREVVLIEGWQFDCCGTPFGVGDVVTWRVERGPLTHSGSLAAEVASRVTSTYEHHSLGDDALTEFTGTVRRIDSVHAPHRRGVLRDGAYSAVPGSAELRAVERAVQFPPAIGEAAFVGYLVELDPA